MAFAKCYLWPYDPQIPKGQIPKLAESAKLWVHYLEMGGSLDPDPDLQSPFFFSDDYEPGGVFAKPGVRVIRRSGI